MAYVIAEPCVATCDQACVEVCPVDCIAGRIPVEEVNDIPKEERKARLPTVQLYIDPEHCICCAACVAECPVSAILEEEALPAAWAHYAELNRRFFHAPP